LLKREVLELIDQHRAVMTAVQVADSRYTQQPLGVPQQVFVVKLICGLPILLHPQGEVGS
jgi:hypothetical protein